AQLAASARSLQSQLGAANSALANGTVKLHPAGGALNARLAELTACASSCALDVQFVRTGALISAARYAEVPIDLSVSGKYRDCAEFLHRIKAQFPDTGVLSFELSATGTATPQPVELFAFHIVWYVEPA